MGNRPKRQALPEFFHSGPPGLARGTKLLPPGARGIYSLNLAIQVLMNPDDPELHRTDLVFVTTDRVIAAGFARVEAAFRIYRVRPIGKIYVDPDFATAPACFCVGSATVLSDLGPVSEADHEQGSRRIKTYTLYPDNSHRYDRDGNEIVQGLLPAKKLRGPAWASRLPGSAPTSRLSPADASTIVEKFGDLTVLWASKPE